MVCPCLPEHTAASYCCRRKGENGHSQVNDVMLQDRGMVAVQ